MGKRIIEFWRRKNIVRISIWRMNRNIKSPRNIGVTRMYEYTKIFDKN